MGARLESPFAFNVNNVPQFLVDMAERHGVNHIARLEARMTRQETMDLEELIEAALSRERQDVTQMYGEPVMIVHGLPPCTRWDVGWERCRCERCIAIRREVAICTELALNGVDE